MFKITLDFDTAEDAILALATLRDAKTAPSAPVKPTPKVKSAADATNTGGTPGKSVTTDKSADGKPDAAAGPAVAPEKKANESSGSATADAYEPVGALIKKLVGTHRAQVLAVLSEFGVPNGKELKPDQYASFVEKLTAATSEGSLD